jgi:serine/threonine-protein kinase
VKLLDFGIAAVVTGGEAAAPETAWVLTPAYASPEQVRGEPVTTASDVYQLGLLLFELLTGRRAQSPAGPSASALVRAVCDATIPRPSEVVAREATAEDARHRTTPPRALASRLRGDLDALVACAVRKAPDSRYGSVGELIDDVQRWQQLRPLSARGSAPGYRLARFARRHRAGLSFAGLAVALAAWLVPAMAGERLRAQEEARRAQQIERVLGGLFPLGGARANRAPAARDYVDHAQALVRRDLAGHPASQGRLMTMFGRTYIALGLYDEAGTVLGDAVALLQRTAGTDSLEVADAMMARGESLHYLGRYEETAETFRQVLSLRRARFGEDHPSVVSTRLAYGDLLHTQGALREAERVLSAGIATRAGDADQAYSLARATRDLANVLRDRGDLGRADALYRDALAGLRGLGGESDVQFSLSNLEYSRLLVLAGRHGEAEQLLFRHLAQLRQTFDGDHPLTGMAHQQFGFLRMRQGRLAEADAHLRTSTDVLGTWLGAEHPMVARTQALQAELARRQGRVDEARRSAEKALAHFERLGLARHPLAIDACRTLGEVLVPTGQGAAALPRLTRCLADADREFVAGDARSQRLRELVAQATQAGSGS